MVDSGLLELATFAAEAEVDKFPSMVIDKVHACLLYGLAVGIAATPARSPKIVCRALAAEFKGEGGRCHQFFDGREVSAGVAAFANAALLHARIQEDAHPAGHVGVVIIPAAVAMAEHCNSSGRDLTAALVAGYEVALRVGRDHVTDLNARGFRSTSVYGTLGAAAAAGRLMGLDAQAMRNALALAANASCGLREFITAGTPEFSVHAAWAAQNGIKAAFLAAEGFSAAATTLSGANGFFEAFGSKSSKYGDRLAMRLGKEFELLDVGYKPYPACQLHRGIIRGSIALRAAANMAPPKSLVIRMHPYEANFVGVSYLGPFSGFPQTFMSAPFCAALAWARGVVSFAGMHEFHAPDVMAILQRIRVFPDSTRPSYGPRLEAALLDGREIAWEDTEGASGYLLSRENAAGMAHALCGEVHLSHSMVEGLENASRNINEHGGVENLVRQVCQAVNVALNFGSSPEQH